MYSLVLMLALPGDVPAPTAPVVVEYVNSPQGGFLHQLFHHNNGCNGCNGGTVVYEEKSKFHLFHHDNGCCGGKAATISPAPVAAPVLTPPPPGKPLPAGEAIPAPKDKKEVGATGQINISLPAEAKLFVDEVPTRSSTAQRVFVTPLIEPGKEFTYTFRAELARDGKVQDDIQVVTVTAGKLVAVSFPNLTAAGGAAAAAGK